jgi:hypothetical protein
MKKTIIFIAIVAFMVSVAGVALGRTMEEEKQAVQDFLKVIDVKIVKARAAHQASKVTMLKDQKAATLARWNKLKAATSVAPVAPPVALVPPPAPVAIEPAPRLHATLAGQYIQDGKHSTIWGSSGFVGNLVFDDFIGLGPKVGMSADSVKYKLGLGGFYVYGAGGIKAIPVYAGGIINLPRLPGGQETYLTGGLNYVVYGNGQTSGKIGGDIYLGLAADLGLGLGKTGFEIGYNVVRSSNITSKGLSFSISQPFII